jgi:electron transfer flavoprotein beta subunit
LNIIVCIKTVPGTITGATIGDNGERLEPVVRSYCINETDEYAIDAAIALRNKYSGKVTVLSAGPMTSEEKLQIAIAKGVDKALRIDMNSSDPQQISQALCETINTLSFDLILTGLESSDNLSAQVGALTGAKLNIPFLFAATKIELNSATKCLTVTKELGEAVYQVIEADLPCVIAVQSGIEKLTYAPVAKLMQARKRGIDVVKMSALRQTELSANKPTNWQYVDVFKVQKQHSLNQIEGTPAEIAVRALKIIHDIL